MAGSVNKVILIGRLGRAPEVRTGRDGNRVAQISLCTSETWRDKQTGERKERVVWHRVVIFAPPLVEIAEKYLRKGSLVHIEGQIDVRKWTDTGGTERTVTEVVLRPFRGEMTLLERAEHAPAPDEGAYDGGSPDVPPDADIPF